MEKKKIFICGTDLFRAKIKEEGIYKGLLAVSSREMYPDGTVSGCCNGPTCYFKNIYDNEYELVYAVEDSISFGDVEDELNDIELLTPQGGCGQVLTIKKISYGYVLEGKSYLPHGANCVYVSKRNTYYNIRNHFGSYVVYSFCTSLNFHERSCKEPTKEIKENVILI